MNKHQHEIVTDHSAPAMYPVWPLQSLPRPASVFSRAYSATVCPDDQSAPKTLIADPLGFFRTHSHRWMLCLTLGTVFMTAGFLARIPLTNNPGSLIIYIINTLVSIPAPRSDLRRFCGLRANYSVHAPIAMCLPSPYLSSPPPSSKLSIGR